VIPLGLLHLEEDAPGGVGFRSWRCHLAATNRGWPGVRS
jgi:hypothetical protein